HGGDGGAAGSAAAARARAVHHLVRGRGALGDGLADLAIGDAKAKTDVHGLGRSFLMLNIAFNIRTSRTNRWKFTPPPAGPWGYMDRPPSTSMVRALKYSHSMTKRTASQMSSGTPTRPTGMAATSASRAFWFMPWVMGVSTIPGAIAPTRMPKGANSIAQVLV